LGTDLWQLGMENGLICANWPIMLSMERAWKSFCCISVYSCFSSVQQTSFT
jgi:hypothetical protein